MTMMTNMIIGRFVGVNCPQKKWLEDRQIPHRYLSLGSSKKNRRDEFIELLFIHEIDYVRYIDDIGQVQENVGFYMYYPSEYQRLVDSGLQESAVPLDPTSNDFRYIVLHETMNPFLAQLPYYEDS